MRTRLITIIFVGITIGFLLALGVVAFLRAVLEGQDPALSLAFTALVLLMAGVLIWYVVRMRMSPH